MDFPVKTRLAGVTFGMRQHYIIDFVRFQSDIGLQREYDNPYDENAIRVTLNFKRGGFVIIGYIPRQLAGDLAKLMDSGIELKAKFVMRIRNTKIKDSAVNILIRIDKI